MKRQGSRITASQLIRSWGVVPNPNKGLQREWVILTPDSIRVPLRSADPLRLVMDTTRPTHGTASGCFSLALESRMPWLVISANPIGPYLSDILPWNVSGFPCLFSSVVAKAKTLDYYNNRGKTTFWALWVAFLFICSIMITFSQFSFISSRSGICSGTLLCLPSQTFFHPVIYLFWSRHATVCLSLLNLILFLGYFFNNSDFYSCFPKYRN